MKRIGNIYHKVFDEKQAVQCLIDGTKQKRGYKEVEPLLYSKEEIQNDKSKWHRIDPKKGLAFVRPVLKSIKYKYWWHRPPRHMRRFCKNKTKAGGKYRDLYVPNIEDHLVGHIIFETSREAFIRGMHPHCCGSVPKRGIGYLVKLTSNWCQNDKSLRYFVKLDIHHFFDSIPPEKLMEVLYTKIKDEDVMNIWREIIYSAPVSCPVGYFTSPWLANLYLEDLDWFIDQQLFKERRGKRIKYVKHFVRYADDILLLGTSKSDLRKAVYAIKEYLREKKSLDIKETWEIKKIAKHEIVDNKWKLVKRTYWIDLCGYKFSKECTIMRDGVYLSTKDLTHKMNKQNFYNHHQCLSVNAKIAWSNACDSESFYKTEVSPYVDVKTTRRIISNVEKKRKRRDN